FGNSRTYGYARRHTGHDLFGSIGTPVVAIESGTVECVGWNQYGGWRIGIRSFDKKRYYYYAHLRKDHPYAPIVKEGEQIKAGDVIGYLGMTGYSATENVNNINVPHLHVGLQLIFDESQKDGPTEIWVDIYNIVKLLQKNCSEVYKDEETGEYVRRYDFYETSLGGM
ncbi:MAG: M23 family metallopeptidase, partial [Candidatus Ornithomonoglobus sp.]